MNLHHKICILGGGVIGASIAHFLSHQTDSICLFEQATCGNSGATSMSKGILRVYDPNPTNVTLAKTGVSFYLDWYKKNLVVKENITLSGLLYRVDPENIDAAACVSSAYHTDDYPILFGRFKDFRRFNSALSWSDQDFVIYEPNGGYGNPIEITNEFIRTALLNGITVAENHRAKKIRKSQHGVWQVEFVDGRVHTCDILIISTGASVNEIYQNSDVVARSIALPVFRIESYTGSTVVIDEIAETYIRPLAASEYACGSQIFHYRDVASMCSTLEVEQIDDARQRLKKLFSPPTPIEHIGGCCGYDGYTKTSSPILKESEPGSNLYLAVGFSGRGFKMAPAIGLAIAKLITNNADHFPSDDSPTQNVKPIESIER